MKAADLQPGQVYAVRQGRKHPTWDPLVCICPDPDMTAAYIFISETEPITAERVAAITEDVWASITYHRTRPPDTYRASIGQIECLWADFDEAAARAKIEQQRTKRQDAKRRASAKIQEQWDQKRAAEAQKRRAETAEGRQEARLEELLLALGVFDSVRVTHERWDDKAATYAALTLDLNQVVFDGDESRFLRLLELLERCEGTGNA